MSPLSPPVLGAAVLVSSPALWGALVDGSTSTSVGLSRFLVALVLCWLALGLVAALVGPPPGNEPAEDESATDVDGAADSGPVTSEAAR